MDTKNDSLLNGVYYIKSPEEFEGSYLFFEKNKFHILLRYDKESIGIIYQAVHEYFVTDNIIYSCHVSALICNEKEDYNKYGEIIDISKNNEEQVVRLKLNNVDTPLVMRKKIYNTYFTSKVQ